MVLRVGDWGSGLGRMSGWRMCMVRDIYMGVVHIEGSALGY